MGYLHDGHISLLTAARERCDVVVMSLFVNPTQFQSGEDLQDYPRDEEHDARAATLAGVDLLYVPAAEEIYPDGCATSVIVEDLTEVLCGDRSRRGLEHFRGVTTVVAKLFNIVQPCRAASCSAICHWRASASGPPGRPAPRESTASPVTSWCEFR